MVFFLEYEQRFKSGFSINTQLQYNRATSYTILQILSDLSPYITHHYGFYIEPRWYFNRNKEIGNPTDKNNIKGLYLSLLAGVKYLQRPNPGYYSSDGKKQFLKGQYHYSTLNLGWQRRFGNHGFLHLQLGTGIQHIPQKVIEINTPNFNYDIEPLSRWQWVTNYKVGIGLVMGSKSDTNIKGKVWSFHQADSDMWKVDLFGLLSALDKEGISGKINIGYEKGIQQSAFSLTTNLVFLKLPSIYRNNQLNIQLAPRYYYNLKKRIRKGKTANNLSADYISMRHQWNIKRRNANWQEKQTFSFLWGTQRRVFERMFFNYELGYDFPSWPDQISGEFISELKIGIAL